MSPNLLLTKNIYLGAVFGYQKFESSSSASTGAPNETSSTLDLSGITADINFGLLLFDNALDINVKYRLLNGNTDSIAGQHLGFNYKAEAKIESTAQINFVYNFSL